MFRPRRAAIRAGVIAACVAHYAPARRLARLLVDDRTAEDSITADAFHSLSLEHAILDRPEDVGEYVITSLVQLARRERRGDQLGASSPDADRAGGDEAARRDDGTVILAAFRLLPDVQRECVALRFHTGLSDTAIGRIVSCVPELVEHHVATALRQLDRALASRGEAAPTAGDLLDRALHGADS